jgi:hypothetical protein
MTYTWYKIFNLTEFEDLGLVSKAYTLNLSGIGQKSILVFKGNEVSVQYEGVTLPIQLNTKNPFEFDGHAVYLDTDTDDVYLGIAIE